ncbi:MAG: hypothetical protein ACREBU_24895, partial [Nitrososphaera sp.]
DGVSDFLIIAFLYEGPVALVALPDLVIIDSVQTNILDRSIEFSVPRDLIGNPSNFDWLGFSAFQPGGSYPFIFGFLPLSPVVDVVFNGPRELMVLIESFLMTLADHGQIVVKKEEKKCPPPVGRARTRDIDGDGINDWRMNQQTHGAFIVEVWCIATHATERRPGVDFFSKRVGNDMNGDGNIDDPGEELGWVGKCPFEGGQNNQIKKDRNGDGLPDIIYWTSTDFGERDNNMDGRQDTMIYCYDRGTNQVTVINVERNPVTKALIARRSITAPPYPRPRAVPGSVP